MPVLVHNHPDATTHHRFNFIFKVILLLIVQPLLRSEMKAYVLKKMPVLYNYSIAFESTIASGYYYCLVYYQITQFTIDSLYMTVITVITYSDTLLLTTTNYN